MREDAIPAENWLKNEQERFVGDRLPGYDENPNDDTPTPDDVVPSTVTVHAIELSVGSHVSISLNGRYLGRFNTVADALDQAGAALCRDLR